MYTWFATCLCYQTDHQFHLDKHMESNHFVLSSAATCLVDEALGCRNLILGTL